MYGLSSHRSLSKKHLSWYNDQSNNNQKNPDNSTDDNSVIDNSSNTSLTDKFDIKSSNNINQSHVDESFFQHLIPLSSTINYPNPFLKPVSNGEKDSEREKCHKKSLQEKNDDSDIKKIAKICTQLKNSNINLNLKIHKLNKSLKNLYNLSTLHFQLLSQFITGNQNYNEKEDLSTDYESSDLESSDVELSHQTHQTHQTHHINSEKKPPTNLIPYDTPLSFSSHKHPDITISSKTHSNPDQHLIKKKTLNHYLQPDNHYLGLELPNNHQNLTLSNNYQSLRPNHHPYKSKKNHQHNSINTNKIMPHFITEKVASDISESFSDNNGDGDVCSIKNNYNDDVCFNKNNCNGDVCPTKNNCYEEVCPDDNKFDKNNGDSNVCPAKNNCNSDVYPVENNGDSNVCPVENNGDSNVCPAENNGDSDVCPDENNSDSDLCLRDKRKLLSMSQMSGHINHSEIHNDILQQHLDGVSDSSSHFDDIKGDKLVTLIGTQLMETNEDVSGNTAILINNNIAILAISDKNIQPGKSVQCQITDVLSNNGLKNDNTLELFDNSSGINDNPLSSNSPVPSETNDDLVENDRDLNFHNQEDLNDDKQ